MSCIVMTEKNKCRQCYSCVRHCPVKAVRVKGGQAEVLVERCISCGSCVKVCSQNAKVIESGIEETLKILKEKKFKVAVLAPSFPAAFKIDEIGRIIGGLKALGFDEVWEVAVGAELVGKAYEELLKISPLFPIISTPCPAIVNLIEKHFPNLIPNLTPLVSPMIAVGRLIKSLYPGAFVIFIGPCIAKKDEAKEVYGVDVVLTFSEMKDLFNLRNIVINSQEICGFDGPLPQGVFRGFPVSGGLLQSLKGKAGFSRKFITVDGRDAIKCLESIDKWEFKPNFVDILMCRGCVDGPYFKNDNFYTGGERVEKFIVSGNIGDEKRLKLDAYKDIIKNLDLTRSFKNKSVKIEEPTEEEIKRILIHTNKFNEGDELNCGACGYDTCREKAVAVYNGIAEIEMCLPYLLTKEIQEKNRIDELNREMSAIIESSYDGVLVTDGQGKILRLNAAFAKYLGVPREDVIGKNTEELEKNRVIYPSITKLVIKEKRRLTLIQQAGKRKLFTTGTPIFNENGEIVRVLINAMDIDEYQSLTKDALDAEKLKKYLEKCTHSGDSGPLHRIVSVSPVMEKLIHLCLRLANVDSTVLLLGESGVGKSLIARFIHDNSPRSKGPFVKINCGSIPASLLESELFGYETGAFTGAKREGKPGLIEMAHKGTLFLDEIGDLPLNLQVKLLQVLQDRELTRIGGIKPIEVDIRIIAATNRDLRKMVEDGAFREDLYYRLSVVPITVPPLRERKEDIEPLIFYFVNYYNKRNGISKTLLQEAIDVLKDYSWPGNVRELENFIERILVTSEKNFIGVEDLPQYIKKSETSRQNHCKITVEGLMPLKEAIEMVEKQLLFLARKQCKNTYEMADLLGINQSTVVRKLKKLKDNS
ncbi:sigma 54-interacting transcriptional regulator [Thermovenabulum sp.]|uniref:sigma 54-interacting transcriptional regulator n=1 Tax=Thermovenabulum sp. TaxID=3100335 RepID=UPI003C7C1672